MSTKLPEIVRRAMVETVTDIGQLSKAEIYQLNKYVKKGWLSRGKGGPFPMLKTVYAHIDYDFDAARQAYVDEAMAAYEIEKRLRASGYFDVSSPNYGVDLVEQQRKEASNVQR